MVKVPYCKNPNKKYCVAFNIDTWLCKASFPDSLGRTCKYRELLEFNRPKISPEEIEA